MIQYEATKEAVPLTEAAHTLGLSYLTMRDKVLRGEIDGFKFLHHWYVPKQALRLAKRRATR